MSSLYNFGYDATYKYSQPIVTKDSVNVIGGLVNNFIISAFYLPPSEITNYTIDANYFGRIGGGLIPYNYTTNLFISGNQYSFSGFALNPSNNPLNYQRFEITIFGITGGNNFVAIQYKTKLSPLETVDPLDGQLNTGQFTFTLNLGEACEFNVSAVNDAGDLIEDSVRYSIDVRAFR